MTDKNWHQITHATHKDYVVEYDLGRTNAHGKIKRTDVDIGRHYHIGIMMFIESEHYIEEPHVCSVYCKNIRNTFGTGSYSIGILAEDEGGL